MGGGEKHLNTDGLVLNQLIITGFWLKHTEK